MNLPEPLNDELLRALADAWSKGHDAARTYYSGGPKEQNPYWEALYGA